MRRALITVFAFMLAFAGCTPTSQVFTDDVTEGFLQSKGITPDDIGMNWYRECRIQGTPKEEGDANKSSAWNFASPADQRRLNAQVERLTQNPEQSGFNWDVPCRATLHFSDAADADALIMVEPVTYRVIEDGPLLTMNTGNALRYYSCQKVYVVGSTFFVKNPECDYQ